MTLDELDQNAKKAYYEMNLADSLRYYAEAFVRIPTLALAYNNYGSILREMGYPKQAYGFLKNAMELEPEDRNAPFNYAVAHLAAGDLNKGWELFENRWRFKHHEHTLEGWSKPRWNGEDITGKKLLVTCEEGDGDNLQFIRFVHDCTNMGIEVIIQTEINIIDLFEASFPELQVITNKEDPPEFDYWTPILSLPKILKVTYDNMPKLGSYLKPSDESIEKWANILPPKKKLRIAYCCKGRSKSYPMEVFIEFIRQHQQYEWINLQAVYTPEEQLMLQGLVTDYFEHIRIWNDTAGLLHHVDVVVSVDTGLAHLAGAMGIKTIILLDKYKTCWRWLYDREDTPWYDSVSLCRQKEVFGYDQQLNDLAKKIGTEVPIT